MGYLTNLAPLIRRHAISPRLATNNDFRDSIFTMNFRRVLNVFSLFLVFLNERSYHDHNYGCSEGNARVDCSRKRRKPATAQTMRDLGQASSYQR